MASLTPSTRLIARTSLHALRGLLALVLLLISVQASAQPVPGVLLSEVHTAGDHTFVELANYADVDIPLEGFFLSNSPDYFLITSGNPPVAGDGQFTVALPADTTLSPGSRLLIALDELDGFQEQWQAAPDAAIYELGDETVQLQPAWAEAIGPGRWQPAANGTLVLFYWDGASDLVADADILRWGEDSAPIDKSGLQVDGPDDGDEPSTYLPDLPAEQQWALSSPGEHTLTRLLVEEGEQQDGGNGLGGHNEPSEPWPRNFASSELATPGKPNRAGYTVTGSISADGAPATGAVISLSELALTALSDDNGQFSLGVVPMGLWTLQAEHGARHQVQQVHVTDEPLAVDLQLAPLGRIEGRILLANQRAPDLAGTQVLLSPGDLFALTDSDGDFSIEGLSDSHYDLTIEHDGYLPRMLERVSTSTDATPVAVTLYSDQAISLTAELRALESPLPPGVRVSIHNQHTNREYAVLTEREGQPSITFDGIDQGLYTLQLTGPVLEEMEIPDLTLLRDATVVLRPVPHVTPDVGTTTVSCAIQDQSPSSPGLLLLLCCVIVIAARRRAH